MSKEITFSEFIKEGTFKDEKTSQEAVTPIEHKPIRIAPFEVATEKEIKSYWKKLRQFYRTGKRGDTSNGLHVPALLAPYLDSGIWDTDYPLFCSADGKNINPLEKIVSLIFESCFSEDKPKILSENLPRLVSYFRDVASIDKVKHDFNSTLEQAFSKLSELEVHGQEGERFRQDLSTFKSALATDGSLYNFHHSVPLYFIKEQFEEKDRKRAEFQNEVKELIASLELKLKEEARKQGLSDHKVEKIDFAEEFVQLDKIEELTAKQGSEFMSQARMDRLRTLIDELKAIEFDWSLDQAYILVSDQQADIHNVEEIFPESRVIRSDLKSAFANGKAHFDSTINKFNFQMIAKRKAELELRDEFLPEVHTEYFENFKWFKLSLDEIDLFPPVLLICGAVELTEGALSELSNSLSMNKLVKIVALTNRTIHKADPEVNWEEASRSYRKELAAVSISHRSAHTLQCGADQCELLYKGIESSMRSKTPSIMHILVPEVDQDRRINLLKINAAVESRYFPYLNYDNERGTEWGSRFDISGNPQAESDWPSYSFSYQKVDGEIQELKVKYSYADYKALNADKVEELMIVPESMVTSNLVVLDEFLMLKEEELSGKVPFIWLVDEDRRLKRAAMPYMWAVSCQERLDFWNFIQELGGVNSYHVKKALEAAREGWEKEKSEEIDALRLKYERMIERTEEEAGYRTMQNLANALLDENFVPVHPGGNIELSSSSAPIVGVAENPTPKEAQEDNVDSTNDDEQLEPWLETFKCTSCNDCTDQFPLIFAYNDDKQAVFKDAQAGSFDDLVRAAEACPAQCIHPGSPFNPDEDHLEELVQRAEPFN